MSVKDMKGRKVLIVEDERRIARFLQMELEHEGCTTAVEDNGSRACERLAREEYDIVLLDVMLLRQRSGRAGGRHAYGV